MGYKQSFKLTSTFMILVVFLSYSIIQVHSEQDRPRGVAKSSESLMLKFTHTHLPTITDQFSKINKKFFLINQPKILHCIFEFLKRKKKKKNRFKIKNRIKILKNLILIP